MGPADCHANQYADNVLLNRGAFTELAKAEQDFWWSRGMERILFRLLDPLVAGRPVQKVVEAGWGTGYLGRMIQGRYDWEVYTLALGWEGQPGTERTTQTDLSALPFPDGSFDAALVFDMLAHVPKGDEDGPMRELARVLAPRGLLIIRAPAWRMFRSRHSEYVGECQRFTRDRLIDLVERHGVQVLRASYVNALLAPVAFARARIWEPLLRRPPALELAQAAWLDKLLYWPLAAESYWLGAGLNFPIGASVLVIGEKQ